MSLRSGCCCTIFSLTIPSGLTRGPLDMRLTRLLEVLRLRRPGRARPLLRLIFINDYLRASRTYLKAISLLYEARVLACDHGCDSILPGTPHRFPLFIFFIIKPRNPKPQNPKILFKFKNKRLPPKFLIKKVYHNGEIQTVL